MNDRKPEELMLSDELQQVTLIEAGNDHRLVDPKPLEKMVETCERFENKTQNAGNR